MLLTFATPAAILLLICLVTVLIGLLGWIAVLLRGIRRHLEEIRKAQDRSKKKKNIIKCLLDFVSSDREE